MSVLTGGIFQPQGAPENDAEIVELARFAVAEHNKKTNALLEFAQVVNVRKQVVAGTMYYINLEAKEGGSQKKLYEAKVWVKPWMNFKQLEDFKTVS